MKIIENITQEAYQRHRIIFNEWEIILTLRFHETIKAWTVDAEFKVKGIYGKRLTTGAFHTTSANLPFDLIVIDNSRSGFSPFQIDDFISRYSLMLIEPSEYAIIRGQEIEI